MQEYFEHGCQVWGVFLCDEPSGALDSKKDPEGLYLTVRLNMTVLDCNS